MLYLVASILSSTFIYIIFKLVKKSNNALFPVIVTNYIAATSLGVVLSENQIRINQIINAEWLYTSIIIGILFIAMFYLIGLSTQKAGLTITSISTKMSVIFPMIFSIWYYSESIYSLKIIGIVLALFSIYLSTINGSTGNKSKNLIFPLILFIGMGIVDSIVKYNQEEYLKNTGEIESTTVVFSVSAIIGLILQFTFNIKQIKEIKTSTFLLGTALGLVNFGSLYFLILALNSKILDSSVIFAINNTSIILLSALAGKFFFQEKLNKANWYGVGVAVIAIAALSY